MAVEFRCNKCHGLLRTPDEAVGKPAKCPVCGNVRTVPEPTAADAVPEGPRPSFGPEAAYPYAQPDLAAERIAVPAVWLMALSGVNLLFLVLGLIHQAIRLQHGLPPAGGRFQDMPPSVMISSAVVGLVLNAVILIGALRMRRLQSYALAMAAAIVALVPCFSPCCVLTLPFGVWAIVVLSDERVRNAFH